MSQLDELLSRSQGMLIDYKRKDALAPFRSLPWAAVVFAWLAITSTTHWLQVVLMVLVGVSIVGPVIAYFVLLMADPDSLHEETFHQRRDSQ